MNPLRVADTTRLEYWGEADGVWFETFMPRFPGHLPFHQVDDTRWRLELDLPASARVEYLLEVSHAESRHRINDPANPLVAENPFGTNSVLIGAGYRPPKWRSGPAAAGVLSEIRVATGDGGRRRHHIYTPPGHDHRSPLPLLVVHDGSEYMRYAQLGRCVDWLIEHGTIHPIRLLLTDPRRRHVEYVGDESHAHHLVDQVLPHVERRYATPPVSGSMGASLGAVAAWHLAWSNPGRFDRLFLQSGTFAFDPHPELSREMQTGIARFLTEASRGEGIANAKVAMSCGRYESLIDWNRRVAADLARARIEIRFEDAWAGHDWGAWSDTLARGLRYLYGTDQRVRSESGSAPG